MYLRSVTSWVDRDALHKPAPGDWVSFRDEPLQVKSEFKKCFTPRSCLGDKNPQQHRTAHKRALLLISKWPACLRAASGGGARRVSGPALLRTAPALPAPWNPNLRAARHSPRNQPITVRALSWRQHQPRFSSPWAARGVGLGDWLQRIPCANGTPHAFSFDQSSSHSVRERSKWYF